MQVQHPWEWNGLEMIERWRMIDCDPADDRESFLLRKSAHFCGSGPQSDLGNPSTEAELPGYSDIGSSLSGISGKHAKPPSVGKVQMTHSNRVQISDTWRIFVTIDMHKSVICHPRELDVQKLTFVNLFRLMFRYLITRKTWSNVARLATRIVFINST